MNLQQELKEVLTNLAEQAIKHRDEPHMVATKVLSHTAILRGLCQDLLRECRPERLSDYFEHEHKDGFNRAIDEYEAKAAELLGEKFDRA